MSKTLSYKTGLLVIVLALIAGCQNAAKTSSDAPDNTPEAQNGTSKLPSSPSPSASPSPHQFMLQEHRFHHSLSQQQIDIDTATDKLLVGQAFHNVPNEMRVGKTYLVEAGIAAKQITASEIRKQLQGEGKTQIIPNVRYDPRSVKMALLVNSDDFNIHSLSPEEQSVLSREPTKWNWEVKPLTSGKHHLLLQAYVNLQIPGSKGIIAPHTIEVFEKDIAVQVNIQYSLIQFIKSNWKEVITLIFGSGSLAGSIGWYLAKRHEKLKEADKNSNSS